MQIDNPHPKYALITGANKGIGFQMAQEMGRQGYYIFLGARSVKRGQEALKELHKLGIEGSLIPLDVSKVESIQSAQSMVLEVSDRLDVLINNAGVLLDQNINILDLSPEASLETLHTNALGPLWMVQTFLPLLKSGSRIINVSSGAGTFCGDFGTWAPLYATSKTSLNALTRHLHQQLASQGISINAVCPGWVRSDMGGPDASRSLAQGAETALWLALEAPEHLSGKFWRDREEIDW